jgi:hypothetical protein
MRRVQGRRAARTCSRPSEDEEDSDLVVVEGRGVFAEMEGV